MKTRRPLLERLAHDLAQARRLVGQDIALHSSGTWDAEGAKYIQQLTGIRYTRHNVPAKAITSVARLAGVLMPGDACPPGQAVWYWGDIALLLDNVRVLPRPVPMLGGLGWLEVPAELAAIVQTQLGELKP